MAEQKTCECIWCDEVTGYEAGCEIIECEWCGECFNESEVAPDEQRPGGSDEDQ